MVFIVQFLEVVKLEGHNSMPQTVLSRDSYLLQVFTSYATLIFHEILYNGKKLIQLIQVY